MVLRRRIEGTRLLGVVLLGFAALAAGPLIRRPQASAVSRGVLSAAGPVAVPPGLRPLAPIGTVPRAIPDFTWEWTGPEPDGGFEVLLFDEEFAELYRTPAVKGGCVDPSACGLSARIVPGERHQWCVQLAGRPETRSAPMPIARR